MESCPWRMRVLLLLLFPSFAFATIADNPTLKYLLGAKYPSSEYEHSFNRDMLLDAEQKFENRDALLSQVSILWGPTRLCNCTILSGS